MMEERKTQASTLRRRQTTTQAIDLQTRLLLAGGLAGVVSKTVVAPFERVKIVCQTGASKGMIRSFVDIVKYEGVLGLWRGNWAASVRILPHKGILFSCTDTYKDMMREKLGLAPTERLSPWYSMVAGACSGITACVFTYPLDFIRTRISGDIMKQGSGQNIGMFRVALGTVRHEGLWALYRGVGPTILGSIPYEGIKFGSYDLIRQYQPDFGEGKASKFLSKAFSGGLAGIIATVLTYPNDTVRRRLQMQGRDGAERIYKNSIDCYVKLIQTEGVSSLYRGLSPTVVRAVPNMGVQFAAYDLFRDLLGCNQ